MDLSVREHERADVVEAKNKEQEKLANYDVFEKVENVGESAVGSRQVLTGKEMHDGQKTK